jgi:hypothetical protein
MYLVLMFKYICYKLLRLNSGADCGGVGGQNIAMFGEGDEPKAVGWSCFDINKVDISFCTYKISYLHYVALLAQSV